MYVRNLRVNILESFEVMSETAIINKHCLNTISGELRSACQNNDFLSLRSHLAKIKFADTNTVSKFADTNTVSKFADTNSVIK